jgi:hypothetical protein
MATVQGTVAQPSDEAVLAIRRVAAAQGWAWHEGESAGVRLVVRKGIRPFSLGSQLTVRVESLSKAHTRVTAMAGEQFALADLGRGRRAATQLLADLGAQIEE